MTNELTTGGFDYTVLDSETASRLRYFAERGHSIMATQIEFIAKMGEVLSEAQAELGNHGNGTFVKWATTEFDIGKTTVYNYMNAWQKCLFNGWTNFRNVRPTALYLLANDETPKAVQKKVEHLAAQQEPVRKADIQRLIDASKPKTKRHAEMTSEEIEQDMIAEHEAILDAEDRGIAPTILGTSDELHADETETAAAGDSHSPAAEGPQQANAKPAEAATPSTSASIVNDSTGADSEARWKAMLRELNQLAEIVTQYTKRKAAALRTIANRLDPPSQFAPPDLEEVEAFCRTRNNGIDAEAFVAHYKANGWRVGKGTGKPMKDWQATVINWEKMSRQNGGKSRVKSGVDYSEYDF